MSTTNYIIVIKQLESGKFLISFPDFEGITTTAETEENIQYIASEVIKVKLAELKKAGIELSEPKKIIEVSKNLQAGEFTTYVSVTENTSAKNIKNNKPVKESFKPIKETRPVKQKLESSRENDATEENFGTSSNKFDNFIVRDLKRSVPEGKEHFLGIGGAILSIISTLIFPVYTISGIWSLVFLGLHFFHLNIFYILAAIVFIALAATTIYASLNRNMQILQISTFANIGVFVIYYIVLFIVAIRDPFLSIGYIKFLTYLLSVVLMYSGYRILSEAVNSTYVEESDE